MSEHDEAPRLPGAVRGWAPILVFAATLFAIGFGCFLWQQRQGFIATSLRNPGQGGAAWGLYIAGDVIFTGISFAGITVAALARLLRVRALEPVTRIAELMTITCLLAGACTIVADLGRPLHGLTTLPRLANPSSPFYGTFTLVVAGYLFSSFVYFFLSGRADAAHLASHEKTGLRLFYRAWATGFRDSQLEHLRHRRSSFWLSLGILPLLVTAHSTLGFIFGTQSGRPGWFGPLQAPAFVVMAGVSGIGALILVTLGVRRLFGAKVPDESLGWLANLLWVLALVYLYFLVVEELTASYAGPAADRAIAHELVKGHFAPWFWLVVASLLTTVVSGFTM